MMTIKKTSTIEFYRVEFKEKTDKHLFTEDIGEFSNITPFTNDFKTIFEYVKVKIDEPNSLREQIIRTKKHRMWIDFLDKRYLKAFVSRENQNGALINKDSLEVKLAQDVSLDVELASISHIIFDFKHKLLALETFDGSISKTGLEEYLNKILQDSNCSIALTIVPREDIEQILTDVKEIIKFRAKYRDIKDVFPDFLDTYIFSSSTGIKHSREDKTFETVLDIRFDKTPISNKDTLIQKFLNSFKPTNDKELNDSLLEQKITIVTNQGNEEIIKLGNNIFIEKLQINLDETITTRKQYSEYIYENILPLMTELIKRKKWE